MNPTIGARHPRLLRLHLCVVDGEQNRTPAALPVSGSVFAYMIATATVWFHVLEDLSSRLFILLLQLIGTEAQAVEGSACKAAALSPAAR